MRPWIIKACHSAASCPLGRAHTLRMLERFCWWIGTSVCTRWWLCHCLKCQTRNISRLTVRCPPSFRFPSVRDRAVRSAWALLGHCRSRPGATPPCCFSPTVLVAERTCSLSLLLHLHLRVRPQSLSTDYIPLWGCPRSFLSDKDLQFCFRLFARCLRASWCCQKNATSPYHPNGNGGV